MKKPITTIEGARKIMETAVPMGEWGFIDDKDFRERLDIIAREKPPTRPNFTRTGFETVLHPNGQASVSQVNILYSGVPEFLFTTPEHAMDSRWDYVAIEQIAVTGPPLEIESIPQPEWSAKSGRPGWGRTKIRNTSI